MLILITNIVAALDGVSVAHGGIDGNGIQIGKQFAEITAISAYSFLVSYAMLMIMKYIPGLHLRVSDETEERGLDLDQFFDEQIGDWSYLGAAEKLRNTTILGQVENVSGASSMERVVDHESKGNTENNVKAA